MSAVCRPGSRSTHCTHSCSGAAHPAGAWFKTSFFLFLFFFFNSPALPPEMILLGCLDDDDFTSHHFLGRAFFQLTFFPVQSHTEQVLSMQKFLASPKRSCLSSPQQDQNENSSHSEIFFFPSLSFSFSRQALIFPLAVGNSDTIPGAALDWVSMPWDGDRQSGRASAAGTALESIPHMDLHEGKVEDLPHQQTCFTVLFTHVLLLEN